jgi:hypothetical protein
MENDQPKTAAAKRAVCISHYANTPLENMAECVLLLIKKCSLDANVTQPVSRRALQRSLSRTGQFNGQTVPT